jgi:DNA polymerase-3 subunit gamma/tau
MDTETLRQHWPDVLDAVKRERRVAWILLNSASVDSLEGSVLTVAFNREGEAKGFATSGHDQVLTGVLGTMLGLNVRVRAVVGTGAGPRSGGRVDPAGRAVPASGAGSRSGTGRAGHGRDDPPDGPGSPPSGPTSGRAAPRGQQAAKGGPDSTSERDDSVRRYAPPTAQARPSGGEKSLPHAPPAADYDDEWPDDAGPAGSGPEPTGMELIERQLGGTVIEEIEEP